MFESKVESAPSHEVSLRNTTAILLNLCEKQVRICVMQRHLDHQLVASVMPRNFRKSKLGFVCHAENAKRCHGLVRAH
jgi:hypothetical protein